jgi:hypothetical protein
MTLLHDGAAAVRFAADERWSGYAEAGIPIRVTSESHPSHIRVTSESHPGHIRVTSESHPGHIQVTSESHPARDSAHRARTHYSTQGRRAPSGPAAPPSTPPHTQRHRASGTASCARVYTWGPELSAPTRCTGCSTACTRCSTARVLQRVARTHESTHSTHRLRAPATGGPQYALV